MLAQDPALKEPNTGLQICPPPALDRELPAGLVISPSSQPCIQNTGHADQCVE